MNKAELVRHCQKSIAKGSKTFTFASRFFSKEKMDDAAILYQWCRHCDDAIDACPPGEKSRALAHLRQQTADALGGIASEIPFKALTYLVKKHSIPVHYPVELIEGMAMDAAFTQPLNERELKLYCYRVAGVVGLMMTHVMGVSHERALPHACDMGMAMQLTNIARDVLEDAKMGRCYLPHDLLARHGLDASTCTLPENREALANAVREILDWAESYYRSGEAGTPLLDRASALVILIARFTYARIGEKVRAAGTHAWDARQYTSTFEKALCLAWATWLWLKQLTLRPRFREVNIKQVWRFQ